MLSRRSTLVAAAALATSAVIPAAGTPSASATADTSRIAALEAENAVLTAKNADLRVMADTFVKTMRDLPEGDYSPMTQIFRRISHASKEELAAAADYLA